MQRLDDIASAKFARGGYAAGAVLVSIMLALGIWGDAARLALRFEPATILGGEYWRFLTGHLVHLGTGHLLWNMAGLSLVWLIFGREFRFASWLAIVAAGAFTISACFFLLRPGLDWYVGFSGVTHGVFGAGALAWIFHGGRDGYIAAACLLGKICFEQFFGAVPLSESSSGGPVIVDAHLYGALGGMLVAFLILARRRNSHPVSPGQ